MLLNIDLGELPDEPEAFYRAADLANIACGGHVGDAASMQRAVDLCLRHGTRIGAHPSYPDRAGFGRQVLEWPTDRLQQALELQVADLHAVCAARGAEITHLKAHGALYHAANDRPELASTLLDATTAVLAGPLTLIAPLRGALRAAAESRGWSFLAEGFADRGRRRDTKGGWQLIPRGAPGAVLTDADEVLAMLEQHRREGEVATLCLHGDNPAAKTLAPLLRASLDRPFSASMRGEA